MWRDKQSVFPSVYGFYGYGAYRIVLSCCQKDAEVIVLVDMQQHGLCLTIGTLGEHVEKIGEQVVTTIWLCT